MTELFSTTSRKRPADEQNAFHAAFPEVETYSYSAFKEHVRKALRSKFGDSVKPGTKAIRIEASGNRRNADVIVAFAYKRFHKFKASDDEQHDSGICFFLSDDTRVANFPNQHCENLTTKHQDTDGNFKPMVRIFKNMRSKLIDDGLIAKGSAPSYYIEGLLYNVPNDQFVGDYEAIFVNILNWLHATLIEKISCVRTNSTTCCETTFILVGLGRMEITLSTRR